jgi:Fe-S cluster assembly protein SufD
MSFLKSIELPTRKVESWRNTSLKFLSEYEFKGSTRPTTKLDETVLAFINGKKIASAQTLVFLNGFYIPELSTIDTKSIMIGEKIQNVAAYQGDPGSQAIHALNEVYNLSPIEITIQNDLSRPLQILNVTYSLDKSLVASAARVQVNLKANKEAKIVMSHGGEAQARYFSNGYFSFNVEKDARLELVNHVNQSASSYHFDFVGINAEAGSTVRYFELNFNSLMTRHEFVLEVKGENIQAEVLGATYTKQSQHCDSQTFINHHKGNSRTEQIYKSLLDDESRSVFSGTVYIAEGIAKTDSAQLNQNLLLSEKAEVNSKPILRIFSDDVKASHGSTIGQIQEDEIFYLQSRSISRSKAIELLGQGFLNAIVLRMGSEELKQYFSKQLLQELGANRKPQLKVLK